MIIVPSRADPLSAVPRVVEAVEPWLAAHGCWVWRWLSPARHQRCHFLEVWCAMSITKRMLAPAPSGERCHFLVQWRDSHATQHGRTFATFDEAAAFDAAIKAGKLPRDAPGRRAPVTSGTVAARWLATKQATKRPSTADLYATELRSYVLPAFACVPLPDITRRDVQEWVNALATSGLSPATVRHAYRAVFKSVLNDAIDDGLLARSPCHASNCPPPPCRSSSR